MKLYLAVLIAAVTVNCLVTTINGTTATDTLTEPFTDMLLPPLEDAQDNKHDVQTAKSLTFKTTVASTKTTSTTTTSSTTEKPITIDVNNVSPELSIEALLPPLVEVKIEQVKKGDNKQQTEEAKTKATATTTTTTTTRRPTTIKPATTTNKPKTTTKTIILKPAKEQVPFLSLEALLPPLFNNLDDSTENIQDIIHATTTTSTAHEPVVDTAILKTTKKSYYQQQTQHLKDLHLIDQESVSPKNYEKQQQQLKKLQSTSSEIKTYKNYEQNQQQTKIKTLTSTTLNHDKQTAESKTQTQKVSLPSLSSQHLQRNIEKLTTQHVAKQVAQHKYQTSSNNDPKQFNYSFDFFLGSTTARPPKNGLPTITPFPHRLGR